LNTHYTYFLLLGASIAGPLALSFDKKVGFYKKWKYLFPAIAGPAIFYIVWDIFFTARGVWSFNDNYITGIKIANLPVEEVLFFFLVPYCCVFIYECIRCYFPQLQKKKAGDILLQLTAVALLVVGIAFIHRYYTSWTFIFMAVFIGLLYFARNFFKAFDATSFLVAYSIVLLPFLVINGFLTALPVVVYNNAENLGIRIYTIPFEDIFYGMLLNLAIVSIYEKLMKRGTA